MSRYYGEIVFAKNLNLISFNAKIQSKNSIGRHTLKFINLPHNSTWDFNWINLSLLYTWTKYKWIFFFSFSDSDRKSYSFFKLISEMRTVKSSEEDFDFCCFFVRFVHWMVYRIKWNFPDFIALSLWSILWKCKQRLWMNCFFFSIFNITKKCFKTLIWKPSIGDRELNRNRQCYMSTHHND